MSKGNLFAAMIFILIGILAILGLALSSGGGGGLRGWLERFEHHHNLLLVGLTGLLAIATALLWWSTRELVTETRDTAQRQLRAYIGPFSMEMTINPYETGGFVALPRRASKLRADPGL